MKAITATLLILASVLTIHFALGASTPDRPAGVEVQNWIPVSGKMGFVVTMPPTCIRGPQAATRPCYSRLLRRAISWFGGATSGGASSSKTP